MARGYMGKILNVDLSTGRMHDEPLDEALCRDFLGGYGLGAKILFDRMAPGVDALGPDNLLGFFTGPLTGSPSIEGNRFMVVCKSPLTDTWGDANCGGTYLTPRQSNLRPSATHVSQRYQGRKSALWYLIPMANPTAA